MDENDLNHASIEEYRDLILSVMSDDWKKQWKRTDVLEEATKRAKKEYHQKHGLPCQVCGERKR